MIGAMRLCLLVCAALLAASCAARSAGARRAGSLRSPSGELSNRRGEVSLCKTVDVHKTGAAVASTEPVEIGDVFYASDWQAVAYVSLGERSRAHTMRFVWYDPSGERYLDSGDVRANASARTHRYNDAWHVLRIWGEPAARRAGRWNVTVYLDGEPLGSRDFTLRPR